MIRLVAHARSLAAAALLSCCTPAPRPTSAPTPIAAIPVGSVCRVGPDGGPLLAERGIGGTGAPPAKVAERGIGGTGAPATQLAERGIGGTGIIGVVTGFASICLAGHEVALPAGVPVEIAGAPADPAALRAGQVAAVEAGGPADALVARRVVVRFEVEGPVETVTPDRLQVAGQTVLLSADTWMRTPPAVGQWVAVSGLRNAAGAIAATRLDLVSTHTMVVHGVVQQDGSRYRIGSLSVVPGQGDLLVPGLPVSLTGVYDDGVLRPVSIAPDLLAADPVAYFGGYTRTFIVEGFARSADGGLYVGSLPLSPAPASSRSIGGGRSVVEFQRTSGGSIRVDSVAPSGASAPGRFQPAPAPRTFEPAPMPNRTGAFGAAPGIAGSRPGAEGFRGASRNAPPGPDAGPGGPGRPR